MTTHKTGTREGWLAARLKLLEATDRLLAQSYLQHTQNLACVHSSRTVHAPSMFDLQRGLCFSADRSVGDTRNTRSLL